MLTNLYPLENPKKIDGLGEVRRGVSSIQESFVTQVVPPTNRLQQSRLVTRKKKRLNSIREIKHNHQERILLFSLGGTKKLLFTVSPFNLTLSET